MQIIGLRQAEQFLQQHMNGRGALQIAPARHLADILRQALMVGCIWDMPIRRLSARVPRARRAGNFFCVLKILISDARGRILSKAFIKTLNGWG